MSEATICTVTTCNRPSDGWFVCQTCSDSLERDVLSQVEWLMGDLDLVISGQVKYTQQVGSASSETPLPLNIAASDARGELLMQLDTSCRMIAEDNGIEAEYHDGPSVAAWLSYRISMIRLHPAGGEVVGELTQAFNKALWLIDRPRQRQYLGDCKDHPRDDGEAVCPGGIYALEGKPEARCQVCGRWWPKEELKAWLIAELHDRIMTASEIARLSAYLGIPHPRIKVRKLINQWHTRGQIHSVELQQSGRSVSGFKFSDALVLLAKLEKRKAS